MEFVFNFNFALDQCVSFDQTVFRLSFSIGVALSFLVHHIVVNVVPIIVAFSVIINFLLNDFRFLAVRFSENHVGIIFKLIAYLGEELINNGIWGHNWSRKEFKVSKYYCMVGRIQFSACTVGYDNLVH